MYRHSLYSLLVTFALLCPFIVIVVQRVIVQSESVTQLLAGGHRVAEADGSPLATRGRFVRPVVIAQHWFCIDFGDGVCTYDGAVQEGQAVRGGDHTWSSSADLFQWESARDGSPLLHPVFIAADTVPGLKRLRNESLTLSAANASNTLALTTWALPVDGLNDAARDVTRLHLGIVRLCGSAAPTVHLANVEPGRPLVFSLPYYGAMILLRDGETMTPASSTALVAALLATYGFTQAEVDGYLAHWREGAPDVLPIPSTVVRTAQARLADLFVAEASRARPNLAALIAAKPSIPVPDYVTEMLDEIGVLLEHAANVSAVNARFVAARAAARLARRVAEDEGTIGALYYPDEHRATIYLPVFLPLILSLIRTAREEWRRYRARHEKTA